MKKKILLVVLIAALTPFFFFSVESERLRAKIESLVSSSGFSVKIGAAGVRLPARITLKAVKIEKSGATLAIPRLSVSVSFIRFLSQKPFLEVSLKEPSLALEYFNPSDFAPVLGDKTSVGGLSLGRLKIENGFLKYKGASFGNAHGDFSFDKNEIEGLLRAKRDDARLLLRLTGKSGDVRAAILVDNFKIPGAPASVEPVKFSVKGRITPDKTSAQFKGSSGDIRLNADAEYADGKYNIAARWECPYVTPDSGSIDVSGDALGFGFRINAAEKVNERMLDVAGAARFEDGGISVETSTAAIRLAAKDITLDGSANIRGFWATDGRSRAQAHFNGALAARDFLARIKISAVQTDERVRVESSLSPGGARADISLERDGKLSGSLSDGKHGRARISGRFAPLEIAFTVDDWDASAISLPTRLAVSGRLSAAGDFTGVSGEWLLKARARWAAAKWDDFRLGDCSADIVAGPKILSVSGASFDGGRIKGDYNEVKGVSRALNITADGADIGVLSAFAGRKVSGSLTGKLVVASLRDKQPSGKADLRVRGLSVEGRLIGDLKAAGGISGPDISFDKFSLIGPSGSVSGGFSVVGSKVKGLFGFGGYPITGDFKAAGQISVSGRYKNPDDFYVTLESKKFSLGAFPGKDSPMILTISSDRSAYKVPEMRFGHIKAKDVTVKKTPVGEISGDLSLKDYPLSLVSKNLKGNLSAEAAIKGSAASPELHVSYAAENVEFSTSVAPGRLWGSGVYSSGVFTFGESKFALPRSQIVFDGKASSASLDISGKISAAKISDIATVPGLASGALRARFKIFGHPSEPTVSCDADVADIVSGGVSIDRARVSAQYHSGKISFGESSVKFGGANEIKMMPGSFVELSPVRYDLKLLAVSLRAGFVSALGKFGARGVGPSAGSTSGSLVLDDFWVGGKKFTDTELLYKFSDGGISLAAPDGKPERFRADIRPAAGGGVSGRVEYAGRQKDAVNISLETGPGRISADISLAAFSVETLSSMFDSPLYATGNVNATLRVGGRPENPTVDARAAIYGGSVSGVIFDEISAEATLNDGALDVVSARAVKADAYRVVASGRLYVAAPADKTKKTISLRNDFTVTLEEGRLSFLEAFAFVKKAEGPVTGRLEFRGTLHDTKLTGFLKIENAAAELSAYLAKINNLNLIATLKENALTVENFSGRSGSGRFLLTGTARIENFAFADMDFIFRNTTSAGIDIFVPELPIPTQFSKETGAKFLSSYSYGKPRFEITIKGDPRSKFTLGGWASLDHTYFSYPPPPPPVGAEDPARDALEKLDLDLVLRSGENTWYENELVSVNIDGAIALKGNYYAPFVTGSVESKRGYISYIGNEFRIQTARLEIAGADAYLEGSASKQLPSAKGYDTISVIIDRSLIGRIQPRFVSVEDPSLSSEKIFARIVGVEGQNMTHEERDFVLRQGLVRLLDSSLATPFAKTLLRRSGIIDLMKVSYSKPAVSDDSAAKETSETLPDILRGTKYTFEKYISDAMLLGYSVTLDEYLNKLDLKHEVEVAYRMKGNVFLRGIYEIDSKSLIRPPERRITIEQQWRFGWPKKK
ncbi:MAG: translocation/assembly module TamB domain-containing protein [Endomicrobiia bacterium]|nr:translocation/assembly module TamB domain-containing protein [Endomicrobiia bacterium]